MILTCKIINIVENKMMIHKQATMAKAVIKLNGFTNCTVGTG